MTNASRFLLIALAALLATTAACDDEGAETDAEFATATEQQVKLAIDFASSGAGAEAVLLFALASEDPEAACPRVELDGDRTTLIGDGCDLDGTIISGRAVGINAPTFSELFNDELTGTISYSFRDFALTDEESHIGFDGEVQFSDVSNEESGEVRSELTLTVDDESIELDHVFSCEQDECNPSGTVEVASLGGFGVSGSLVDLTGSLRLDGADVLTVNLVEDQCVTYQVDGVDGGTYCPDGVDDAPANLALPVRGSLVGARRLLRQ